MAAPNQTVLNNDQIPIVYLRLWEINSVIHSSLLLAVNKSLLGLWGMNQSGELAYTQNAKQKIVNDYHEAAVSYDICLTEV